MKYFCLTLLVCATSTLFAADLVTPVSVIATSEFGAVDVFGDGNLSAVFAGNLIDGSGLVNADGQPCTEFVTDCYHDFDANGTTMWTAGFFDAGIAGGQSSSELDPPKVDDQILEFDLGRRVRLTAAYIWQENQGGAFGALAPRRGVAEFELLASSTETGDNFESAGVVTLEAALGEDNIRAQLVSLAGPVLHGARRVRFDINSVTSPDPLPEAPHPEFEFVGLSEVRFAASQPGDADNNHKVEFADFLSLSKNFGQAGGWEDGDFDFDDEVGFSDFLILSGNFGNVGVLTAQSVPEPSAQLGMLIGCLALGRIIRRLS